MFGFCDLLLTYIVGLIISTVSLTVAPDYTTAWLRVIDRKIEKAWDTYNSYMGCRKNIAKRRRLTVLLSSPISTPKGLFQLFLLAHPILSQPLDLSHTVTEKKNNENIRHEHRQ